MHLAASPVHLPQNDTLGRAGALWSFPSQIQTANDKDHLIPPSTTILPMMQMGKLLGIASLLFEYYNYLILEGYGLSYSQDYFSCN